MNELFQRMSALGGDISQDLIFSATLLGSLPESYDNLITALEARDQELTSNLVGESVSKISSVKNDTFSCHFCKGKGHLRKHYMKYTEWLKKNKSKAYEKPDSEANKPGIDWKLIVHISQHETGHSG